MQIRKGDRVGHLDGIIGTALTDQKDGTVRVRHDSGVVTTWTIRDAAIIRPAFPGATPSTTQDRPKRKRAKPRAATAKRATARKLLKKRTQKKPARKKGTAKKAAKKRPVKNAGRRKRAVKQVRKRVSPRKTGGKIRFARK